MILFFLLASLSETCSTRFFNKPLGSVGTRVVRTGLNCRRVANRTTGSSVIDEAKLRGTRSNNEFSRLGRMSVHAANRWSPECHGRNWEAGLYRRGLLDAVLEHSSARWPSKDDGLHKTIGLSIYQVVRSITLDSTIKPWNLCPGES